MEKKLYEWYIDMKNIKKLPITAKMMKNKALEYTKLRDFNASKGWLEKLRKKYKLELSRSSKLKNDNKNEKISKVENINKISNSGLHNDLCS
jgi:hypothetical protein